MESNPQLQKAPQNKKSPQWTWTTKLIVGMILAALGLILVVRFQAFIGPLLTAFLIAYLFQPLRIRFIQQVCSHWWLRLMCHCVLVFAPRYFRPGKTMGRCSLCNRFKT